MWTLNCSETIRERWWKKSMNRRNDILFALYSYLICCCCCCGSWEVAHHITKTLGSEIIGMNHTEWDGTIYRMNFVCTMMFFWAVYFNRCSMFSLQTNPKLKWADDAVLSLYLVCVSRAAHVLLLIIFKIFTIQSNHKSHTNTHTHTHSIKCCKTRERGEKQSTRRPYKICDIFRIDIDMVGVVFAVSDLHLLMGFWFLFGFQ